jgi:hypothetical protein
VGFLPIGRQASTPAYRQAGFNPCPPTAGRVNVQIVLFFSKNGYNKNNENKFFKKY